MELGSATSSSAIFNQITPVVLHLRASPFLGGPEKLLLEQLTSLDRARCEYIFAVFDEERGRRNEFLQRIRDHGGSGYALSGNVLLAIVAIWKLIRVIRTHQVNIICAHDYKSNFFGLVVSTLVRTPLVCVFHGRTSSARSIAIYYKIDDHVLSHADAIIAVCRETHRILVKNGLAKTKVHTIPNGVSVKESVQDCSRQFREQIAVGECDRLVMFAGRLTREKGLYVLIDAMRSVLEYLSNVKFVILGDGPERQAAQARLRELGLEEHVRVLGFRHDVESFYRESELCVLPSFTEGLPRMILEAYSYKRPVVATRVGGIPELVKEGVNGLLVEPGDAKGLANAIVKVLTDRSMGYQMGLAGYEMVCEQFSMQRQVAGYMNVFYQTLGVRAR